MTRCKSQHYVPRLHLREFVGSSPKGMIWTYDKVADTQRPSLPERTGAANNFYSPRGLEGNFIDDLDQWLTGVEDKAAPSYRKLCNLEPLAPQERSDFATFVSSLHLRSPAILRAYAEGYAKTIQLATRMRWPTKERFAEEMSATLPPQGVDTMWDMLKSNGYKMEVDIKRGLSIMAASDDVQRILFHRNWYLIRPSAGFFITSDAPVQRVTPKQFHHPAYGDGGFAHVQSEVTMPLAPDLLLLITGQELGGWVNLASGLAVQELNRLRAAGADRFLYAHVRETSIRSLAAECKDSRPSVSITGDRDLAEIEVVHRLKG